VYNITEEVVLYISTVHYFSNTIDMAWQEARCGKMI